MSKAFKYIEELEREGFTTGQAKASVNIWTDLMEDNLATKHDLEKLSLKLHNDMKNQTIKFNSMLVAAVSLLAILIKF